MLIPREKRRTSSTSSEKLIPYFPSELPGKGTFGITAKNDFTGFQKLHQSQFIRILKFRSIVKGREGGGGRGGTEAGYIREENILF